jgi:CO/xanthine dehydrogenase Mo-binding subunit/aerobic-type carbon monoxide dehydrogenase small subunit (CoxS/CutS family)
VSGVAGITLTVNGRTLACAAPAVTRLSDALRHALGLTGTKVGCNTGDCGACTVLVDGRPVCACLTALGQVEGCEVTTVEGLGTPDALSPLQCAFLRHGATQCGICTPGMLMAATGLLRGTPHPGEGAVLDAIGGVLCRCTGYRKIIEAIGDAAQDAEATAWPAAGQALGARAPKVDAPERLCGTAKYGADGIPADALWLRVVRSPHAHARFRLGDLDAFIAGHPGIVRVFTAGDVPSNAFGIYPDLKDQPVLAAGSVRFRGEAVLAIVGERSIVEGLDLAALPIAWTALPAIASPDAAMAPGVHLIHDGRPGNVLVEGGVRKGDVDAAFGRCAAVAEGTFETGSVEHAYIEPEAGWARRVGDRLEIHVTTQSPYLDRDETALVLKLAPSQVRIVPTACGGGFGGKLDLSVQPLVGLAAWVLGHPVACVYTRAESMASTTKRHPTRITARFGADRDGLLQAVESHAVFDTGAYASWGPTVANRVPIHATGPYHVPHVRTSGKAVYTHTVPAGAFRGFGVPQSAFAHEALVDSLALALGIDRLEIRHRNALRAGQATATGQVLGTSCGLAACLDALRPHWKAEKAAASASNGRVCHERRGVGIACMWYGIGNTSMPNPSEMRVGLAPDGTLTLYNGCADIGQGTTTTMLQVCADAVGLPMVQFRTVTGDTDLTLDAGKSSASRQAFVSGNAAARAGFDLRRQLLDLAGAGPDAVLTLESADVHCADATGVKRLRLGELRPNARGHVVEGYGRFDPPTAPLDAHGQGVPYATYGFAAQLAVVAVDVALGTTRVLRVVAAHDVGRAINPREVEGQIHGGIAQGIGMALMEAYVPGRTDNLHDYLIPTAGDVPAIDVILVEDREPLGPGGAKGVGEPALVATPAAIAGAIHDATGVRPDRLPVTPPRLRALLRGRAG